MKLSFACLLFLTIITVPLIGLGQQATGYELLGRIKGLRDGTKIVMKMMVYNPGEAVAIPQDSAYVRNGEFVIHGKVPDGPRVYWMYINNGERIYRMFIDNGQSIKVRYDSNVYDINYQLLDSYLICDGSPTNQAAHVAEKISYMYDYTQAIIQKKFSKMRDSVGFDETIASTLAQLKVSYEKVFQMNMLNPMDPELLKAATFLALNEGDDHSRFWSSVYKQLDDHQRNSVLGKKLEHRLPLLEGETMPGFRLRNKGGKMTNLTELLANHKVTLVHFWANNSFNRKAYDNDLRHLFAKYHPMGLNVVGISSESTIDKWLEALSAENYPWENVIDPQGKLVVDPEYHELGEIDHQNTTNVLLDPQGHIIAWDPQGALLEYYIKVNLKNN